MMRINKSVRVFVIILVAAGLLTPLIAQWLPNRRPSFREIDARHLHMQVLRLILDCAEKALWQQDFEKALEGYQRALELDPTCVPALIGRGTVYQFLGKHDLAIRDLDRVVDAHSEQAQSYTARALVYRLAGNDEQAVEDLTTALKLQPANASTLVLRSQAYRAMGRSAQAMADLQKAMELDPCNVEGHIELADVHREKGELDTALARLDHAVKLDPHSARGFRARAGILFNRGEYARAAADLKAATRQQPDYPYLRVRLFLAQSRAGDNKEAADALWAYRATLDDERKTFPTAIVRACLDELAPQELLAAAASGDPKRHQERVCKAHYYIGQLQLLKGDAASSRESFEKCVDAGEKDAVEFIDAQAELNRSGPSPAAPGQE